MEKEKKDNITDIGCGIINQDINWVTDRDVKLKERGIIDIKTPKKEKNIEKNKKDLDKLKMDLTSSKSFLEDIKNEVSDKHLNDALISIELSLISIDYLYNSLN